MDSFIPWVGGKRLLRKEIIGRFPDDYNKYVEVFGGAAWVLFHKEKRGDVEIYNDINGNLVNLFKCIKHHPNALQEEIEWVLNARQIFEEYKEQYCMEGFTDIQRAARYYYVIKASYGAKLGTYGVKDRKMSIIKNLQEISGRLSSVIIENKSFQDLIAARDANDALFYLDPPYYMAEKLYDTGHFIFNKEQHILLCNILKNLKGKFILSYNNDFFIKELYSEFTVEEIERSSSLAAEKRPGKKYQELIIRNF